MADEKVSQKTALTSLAEVDLLYVVDVGTPNTSKNITVANARGSLVCTPTAASDFPIGKADGTFEIKTLAQTKTILGIDVKKLRGFVSNPQAVYAQRAQIVLMRADAALTITRIHIVGPDITPGAELAGDLKFADDQITGTFANATVIDVCDTTSGVFTATSGFDDATVPSGKWIYFQMDASPNADWKDFSIEVFYTYD